MKLQEIRRSRGLSQSKLAKAAGINLRTLQYYEQGVKNFDHAKLNTILKCAIALKCKMSAIISNPLYLETIEQYEKSQE